MDRKRGEKIPDHCENADVLHDNGIRPHIREHGQFFRRGRNFRLFNECIESDVNLFTVFMRICNEFRHLLRSEVFRTVPRIEFLQTAVNSIRSRVECGKCACHISRRRQKLDPG